MWARILGEKRLCEAYKEIASKKVKEGLKAEFQDDNGRWYYSFRDEQDVPIARLAEAHTHLQYMTAGLSGETFDKVYTTLNELFAKGEIVKAGAVIADLIDLNRKIINFDAIVNLLAVNYVREDEDANVVNQSIHAEKCDYLKRETEQGRFFFQLPKFAKLLNGQIHSKEELESYYQSYLRQQRNLLKRWSILASENFTQQSNAKG